MSYFSRLGPASDTAKVDLVVYLDYTCPFSAKMYKMLVLTVFPAYKDSVAVTFKHQIQPWHPQSPLCHEAALAVKKLGGDDAFWKFSTALMEGQEAFFDANTWDLNRTQIYAKLIELAVSSAQIDAAAMGSLLQIIPATGDGALNRGNEITNTLKACIKEGRQTGIHVSPTTVINGIVTDTSSGWPKDKWDELFAPLL